MKSSKAYRRQQISWPIEQLSDNRQPTTDNSSNPIIQIQNKELNEILQKAIDLLKGKQKTVLILRDIDGHSYEEIADITGLKLGTVRSTLNRARLKIAGKISKYLER